MALGTRRVLLGALTCALMASIPNPAFAQGPQLFRVGMVKLKSGGQYDFDEASKLVNEAYKKAGVPWRQVWRPVIFGEMGRVVTVAAVRNYAQFDSESPMAASLSAADRIKFTNLMRNSVESAHYTLNESMPALSIQSGRSAPPRFARVTTVHVLPGKNAEFEDIVRTMVVPALKKANVKDYWVNRTVLGGPMGAYTLLLLFDKWAELDSGAALDKALGPEGFKQFMARIATVVASSENMIASMDAALSYQSQ